MTIRVIFRCSRCGSKSFRPSSRRTSKDTVLRKIGVTPQRCLLCRRRFYLYRPVFFQLLMSALSAPPLKPQDAPVILQPKIPRKPAEVVTRRTIELGRLAEADPQREREDLAG
jgi:hypothetical protein